jgi:hypothetical protein
VDGSIAANTKGNRKQQSQGQPWGSRETPHRIPDVVEDARQAQFILQLESRFRPECFP